MKKLITFSILLMFIALVCGAIDFARETRNNDLAALYSERKDALILSIRKNVGSQKKEATTAIQKEPVKEAVVAEEKEVKKEKKEKKLSFDNFSRGAIDYEYVLEERRMEKERLAAEKAALEKDSLDPVVFSMDSIK